MFRYMKIVDKCSHTGMDIWSSFEAEGSPMPDLYLNNRPVYVGDIHMDGVDSFIESAIYADTDIDLDDEELEDLHNSTDYLAVKVLEHYGYGVK